MKRPALILLGLLFCLTLAGQNLEWRFSPEYTFPAPGKTQKEMEYRALRFRTHAELNMHAPEMYQYDTKRASTWISSINHIEDHKPLKYLMSLYLTIIPGPQEYVIKLEKAVIYGYYGRFAIYELDQETLREDESVYKKKDVQLIVQDAKKTAFSQMEEIIPIIRQFMEEDDLYLELEPENP